MLSSPESVLAKGVNGAKSAFPGAPKWKPSGRGRPAVGPRANKYFKQLVFTRSATYCYYPATLLSWADEIAKLDEVPLEISKIAECDLGEDEPITGRDCEQRFMSVSRE